MKTKVWLAIWGLKDGGAEVLTREYARLIDDKCFDVTIVTMYPMEDTANARRAREAGIRVISVFRRRNLWTRMVRVLFDRWYVPFAFKCMLKQEEPDVIHFNSPVSLYFAPIRNQLKSIRLLYTCHSEVEKHFFPKEEVAVRQLIRDNGLRLIGLHDDMKQELDRHFGKKDTVVIRNGVDLSRFREAGESREETRRKIGIPADAFVVGHVGRFSQAKNHAFLLKVFQKVGEKKANARLLLIGNGELWEEITGEIRHLGMQEKVTILSHRTDIPELLRSMDVMLFPSFYEGLSVTLVEAQASGLRCVISDSINPANLLAETTIPVSLKAAPEEWADIALDETLRNPEHGNLEDYDMNREIRRLERLYERNGNAV